MEPLHQDERGARPRVVGSVPLRRAVGAARARGDRAAPVGRVVAPRRLGLRARGVHLGAGAGLPPRRLLVRVPDGPGWGRLPRRAGRRGLPRRRAATGRMVGHRGHRGRSALVGRTGRHTSVDPVGARDGGDDRDLHARRRATVSREAGDAAIDGVRYAIALMPLSALTISVLGLARGRRRRLRRDPAEAMEPLPRRGRVPRLRPTRWCWWRCASRRSAT